MKKSIFILALFFIITSNAQKLKEIKGNQKIVTITRTTSEYDKIIIAGSFDLKLVSGTEGTITLEGDENLLEYIKTDVRNGSLNIAFDKTTNIQYNYKSSIEISIPIEQIDELVFSGSGNVNATEIIVSDNFKSTITGSGNVSFVTSAKILKITKAGSGNLTIKGKATQLEVSASGSGNINLFDLTTQNAVASQTGSGNINLNCIEKLDATTAGSGSIQYKGNPKKINKNSSGSGGIFGN